MCILLDGLVAVGCIMLRDIKDMGMEQQMGCHAQPGMELAERSHKYTYWGRSC